MNIPTSSSRQARLDKVAVLSGPALSVVVFAVHPNIPADGPALLRTINAHYTAWTIAHSLAFFDGILYLVGALILCARLRSRRPRAARVAQVLLVVGSVAISAISAAELVLGRVARVYGDSPPDDLAGRFDHGGTHVFVGGLVMFQVIGFMILAFGFWRSGLAPLWVVPTMVVGGLLFFDPSDGPNHLVMTAGEILRLAALAGCVFGRDARAGGLTGARTALAAVAVGGVLGGCASGDQASPPPSSALEASRVASTAAPGPGSPLPGRLIYSRFDEATHEFESTYSAHPDGSRERVIPMPGTEGGGRWSHTGDRIAVATPTADGRISTAILAPDGTVERSLALPDTTLNLACAVWSPDDTRLACEGWDNKDASRRGIYTVRAADGSDRVRVTTAPADLVDLPGDYSPDGRRLVFKRAADEADGPLLSVAVEGGTARELTGEVYEDDGTYAPDGTAIATSHGGSLVVLDANGAVRNTVADDGAYLFGPAWSPDGQWLAYSRSVDGPQADVWISRPDGSEAFQVTRTPGNEIAVDWGAIPALVGEWQRVQQCSELAAAFKDAGLGDAVLEQIAGDGWLPGVTDPDQIKDPRNPCDGAAARMHSHFFTEDGTFGSRDENGDDVDDGQYHLVGTDTMVIDDVTFHYVITGGDTIAFTPVLPACAPSCPDASWSVSVANPGHTWERKGD